MIKPDELVVIDFETYYAADYTLSLKSINTSEYVRDPRFLIHGVGIKDGQAPAVWIAGHDQAIQALADKHLRLRFRPVVAHNTAFDGFVLAEKAQLLPGMYCDTLSMARATMGHSMRHHLNTVAETLGLGSKIQGALASTKGHRTLTKDASDELGRYCINDVELCHQIFWTLYPYMPWDEMRLIDLTLRMFCDPLLEVDEEMVRAEWEREKQGKQEKLYIAGLDKDVLMSNQKFAALLRDLGVEPPTKISARTKQETYAFAKSDQGFKDLLNHADEAVQLAAEARLLIKSTINETRAERLLKAGENGQKLPVLLNYSGAHTHRWSGGNKLNLQNFIRRGVLRRSIMAPERHQLLVLDMSQIEARVTVWLAGQTDIVNAFRARDEGVGEDVYRIMAAKLFNVPVQDVDGALRFIGKTATLGLGFGMGWKKLRMMLKIGFMGADPIDMSIDEAKHIVNSYRAANPHVVELWDRLSNLAEQMAVNKELDFQLGPLRFMHKMIELPSGLALRYPGMRRVFNHDWGTYDVAYESRSGTKKLWGGFLLENIAQALARCIIAEHMLEIRWPIATMTHDEVVVVVPDEEIEQAYSEVSKIMTTPPSWAPDLPLAVEGGYDRRYIK